VRAIDALGHAGPVRTRAVRVDTVLPETTAAADDAPHAPPYSFGLSAGDATSGVAHTYWYRLGRLTTHEGASVVLDGTDGKLLEGEQTVVYWSVDAAGNVEEAHLVTVCVDGTPPTTKDDSDGRPHDGDVMLHFTSYDGCAGVASTWSCVDGSLDWVEGDTLVVPASLGAGTHYVWYYSVDAVGNVEPTRVTWVVLTGVPAP